MPNKSWKNLERQVAKVFFTLRSIGSGSMGRKSKTTSDTESDEFYIEVKHRATNWVTSQFREIFRKAKRESKLPVMVLKAKNCHNMLVIIDIRDLSTFVEQYSNLDRKKLKDASIEGTC